MYFLTKNMVSKKIVQNEYRLKNFAMSFDYICSTKKQLISNQQ